MVPIIIGMECTQTVLVMREWPALGFALSRVWMQTRLIHAQSWPPDSAVEMIALKRGQLSPF